MLIGLTSKAAAEEASIAEDTQASWVDVDGTYEVYMVYSTTYIVQGKIYALDESREIYSLTATGLADRQWFVEKASGPDREWTHYQGLGDADRDCQTCQTEQETLWPWLPVPASYQAAPAIRQQLAATVPQAARLQCINLTELRTNPISRLAS